MKYNHIGISPGPGLTVAFIEVNGAPVELMQYDKNN